MSNAQAGIGSQFKRGDGASSESFTAIAEVINITGPALTRDFIDVTNLDSVDGYREFITGFRDSGEVTITANWTRDGYVDMMTDYESDDSVNYQIVIADTGNTTLDFAGYVTGMPMTIPTGAQITMDITVKITGQVALTS